MLITRKSTLSGKENTMDLDITPEQLKRWESGEHIQNVVPAMPADQREFIISGITPEEWNEVFGDPNELVSKFKIDNYDLLHQEDECAPDAREYFDEQFEKTIGFSVADFKSNADTREDLGDTVIYYYGDYALANEIGNHSLYKKKP